MVSSQYMHGRERGINAPYHMTVPGYIQHPSTCCQPRTLQFNLPPRNARTTHTPRHRCPPPQRLPRWYQAIYRLNVCPLFSLTLSLVPRNATPYISSCQLTTPAHVARFACRPALTQVPNKDVRREWSSETINVSKSLTTRLAELLRTYLEVGTL